MLEEGESNTEKHHKQNSGALSDFPSPLGNSPSEQSDGLLGLRFLCLLNIGLILSMLHNTFHERIKEHFMIQVRRMTPTAAWCIAICM